MADLMETDHEFQPRVIMTTQTGLSDRFKQLEKPKAQAPTPSFDLEHDDGHEVPSLQFSPRGGGIGFQEEAHAARMLSLQYAERRRQQTQRLMARARYEARAELAAALGSPYDGEFQQDFGYSYPSFSGLPRGIPSYRRGSARFTPAFVRNRMIGPQPLLGAAAMARATPSAALRGRVGGTPRGNFNVFTAVRKGTGSIVKTSVSGRSPFGNISIRRGSGISPLNRGRGGGDSLSKTFKRESMTKEELDNDLDDYMSKARAGRAGLDKELDAYMNAAKAAKTKNKDTTQEIQTNDINNDGEIIEADVETTKGEPEEETGDDLISDSPDADETLTISEDE